MKAIAIILITALAANVSCLVNGKFDRSADLAEADQGRYKRSPQDSGPERLAEELKQLQEIKNYIGQLIQVENPIKKLKEKFRTYSVDSSVALNSKDPIT